MACYRKEYRTYRIFCWKSLAWLIAFSFLFVIVPISTWQLKINNAYHRALSEWNENAPRIVAHNQFWQMVAGELESNDASTELLANDICRLIKENQLGTQKERYNSLWRLSTSFYGNLTAQVGSGEVYAIDSTGYSGGFRKMFWENLGNCIHNGTQAVLWKELPKPLPSDPQYQRYNVWENKIFWWLVAVIWLVVSALTYWLARIHFNGFDSCLCSAGMPSYDSETRGTHWNLKGEEGHWQLLTILLLLPFFLTWLSFIVVREIFLLVCRSDRSLALQVSRASIKTARSWNRERTHPYRHEKAVLFRSTEGLEALQAKSPEPDGDISQELKRIEALILELDELPQKQRRASEDERAEIRHASRLARITGDIDEVQSTIEAHKEVGASP